MTGSAASIWMGVVVRYNIEVSAKLTTSSRLSCTIRWPQNQEILTTLGTISPYTKNAIKRKRIGFVVENWENWKQPSLSAQIHRTIDLDSNANDTIFK